MSKKDTSKKLQKLENSMNITSRKGDLLRARSITVGTCFGGTTEIMMRGNDGSVLWSPMQPVEVIELIHQLAANVGCHIHVKPRNDFSSWREWRVTDDEKQHLNGHPPFVNDMAPHAQVGANLPLPEQQPGLKFSIPDGSESNDEVMAIKKTVNKRSVKRATKTP